MIAFFYKKGTAHLKPSLHKMQLRTGKITGVTAVVSKQQKEDTPSFEQFHNHLQQLYLNEIQTMMDELEEWSDCPSARMGGLVEIYSYIDEVCMNFKGLSTFHKSIGASATTILSDVSRLAPTADEETLHQMKKLAPILISVIAKLA